MRELSKAEKLLVAAARLAKEGKSPFSAEDLIVRAFNEFPGDFALKGYPEYPHSNVVLTNIMGKKAPLIVKGWLEKTGTNQYRLTSKGLHDVELLELPTGDAVSVYVDRAVEEKLGRLMTSEAYKSFRAGRGEEITFHQFCRFAGLSARDKWQKVSGRLSEIDHLSREAKKIGEGGQSIRVHFRQRNYTFSSDDLRMLDALRSFLSERFKQEMLEWKKHALA